MDTVLVFGTPLETLAALGPARRMGEGELHVALSVPGPDGVASRRDLVLLVERDAARALRRLSARTVDAVVVDGRGPVAGGKDGAAAAFLRQLFPAHEVGGPAPRNRTVVLTDASSKGAELAFFAGRCRVGSVIVEPEESAVLQHVASLTGDHHGKIALCLAGGGIEGLLYELGVLRALDHFLEERKVRDLDLFCGISAGSIIAALLANGLSPAEITQGMRHGTSKLEKITRRDVFDPNVRELGQRLVGLARDIAGFGEARNPISALYRALPSGAFAGDALKDYVRRQLTRPGMSDRFDDLRRPLFIGATDQDTAEAVLFGEPGLRDVPVHQAVRASSALAPFYAPEKVGGRYYVDGAFTRTTNMRVAAKHGATMVVLVDPLVPIYSEVAGYVRKRGGLFGTMQGLKSLINGRFDKAVTSIREMYPDVSFHLFRPEGDEMRVLSGSPMKFLYREEIEELAYERTLKKIRATLPDLARDFARHGVIFREPARRDSVAPPAWLDDAVVAA